jgi:hypothetical protein
MRKYTEQMAWHEGHTEEKIPTQVVIWFQITDANKRKHMLDYLKANPKGLWNCEQRVQEGYQVQPEKHMYYFADWPPDEITYVHTQNLVINSIESDIIEYEVTLRKEVKNPKNLVDILRQTVDWKKVDGIYNNYPREWTINAWYRGGEHHSQKFWDADTRNNLRMPIRLSEFNDERRLSAVHRTFLDAERYLNPISKLLSRLKAQV